MTCANIFRKYRKRLILGVENEVRENLPNIWKNGSRELPPALRELPPTLRELPPALRENPRCAKYTSGIFVRWKLKTEDFRAGIKGGVRTMHELFRLPHFSFIFGCLECASSGASYFKTFPGIFSPTLPGFSNIFSLPRVF